jgi:hypothetical protein
MTQQPPDTRVHEGLREVKEGTVPVSEEVRGEEANLESPRDW